MSFVCPSVWLSVRPSIHLSVHQSVHPLVCLYICLCIHLALYFCMYACSFIQIVSAWKVRRNCRILFRFVLFPKGSSILQYFNGLFCCIWTYVSSNRILKILHCGFTGDLLMLYFFPVLPRCLIFICPSQVILWYGAVRPSICLFCLFVHPSICLSVVHLSVCVYRHIYIYIIYVCTSVCMSGWLYFCISVHLSVCPSVCIWVRSRN